ncbi:hypothetical protein [Allohahella sp. A8]|uniref:hypothetical protein n=1 Tax=Allohahella sp. A8 TaxID=3141461 RepID=UPI00269C8383
MPAQATPIRHQSVRRQNAQFYKAMFATAFIGLLALAGSDRGLPAPPTQVVSNGEDTSRRAALREHMEWLSVEKFNPDFVSEPVRILTSTFGAR